MQKRIIGLLQGVAQHKNRHRVFEDFITIVAVCLHNQKAWFDKKREEEYLKVFNSYHKSDQEAFTEAFGLLVMELGVEPKDVLGSIYMSMELGDSRNGQYFTPDNVSYLMAQFHLGDIYNDLKDKDYISLSDPASGSGGMILAVIKGMLEKGFNPSSNIWVQATDISRVAALMCYIQLSLWGVPAQIIVGNSLSLEVREVWNTPIFLRGGWIYKQ
ncbi:MAG: SAM-dependent methyltransferase [Psychrobacter sp.]|uniref:N-6 DNA methylase n=1 Tax=Psychrobacter sp. TaxID=56811 RepID=UPI00264704B4|nr:N-6 DNA methylase [Psychrobacter sp.]MDN5619654.1 SAM-dependent methyltransferase [Psychrobacter sp.]